MSSLYLGLAGIAVLTILIRRSLRLDAQSTVEVLGQKPPVIPGGLTSVWPRASA